MQKTRYILLSLLCLFFAGVAFSQVGTKIVSGEYLKKTFEQDGNTLNYRILYPNDFDQNNVYPLVIFLHGRGERGDDNKKQLTHGSKLFLDNMESYPAIVIFPQCPVIDYWSTVDRKETDNGLQFTFVDNKKPNPSLNSVIDLIEVMLKESYIDNDRLYVTGLSMGGMGVFELLALIPDKIAAAAPICGGGIREAADRMVSVPVWAFHGAKDNVVHPRHSIRMVEGIQQAGGMAKITIYPNANHNAWDATFADPEYLQWLFSKRRN